MDYSRSESSSPSGGRIALVVGSAVESHFPQSHSSSAMLSSRIILRASGLALLVLGIVFAAITAYGTYIIVPPNRCQSLREYPSYSQISSVDDVGLGYRLIHVVDSRIINEAKNSQFISRIESQQLGEVEELLSANEKVSRQPILYVHGHYGSYQQVRHIVADYAALKIGELTGNFHVPKNVHFDFFAVDFMAGSSAFHASVIRLQAKFIKHCLQRIHDIYGDKEIWILAHSMGGVAVRLALHEFDLPTVKIGLVLTLNTPHRSHPFPQDRSWKTLYNELNDASSVSKLKASMSTESLAFISITGGSRDPLIRAELADISDLFPPDSSLFLQSSAVSGVWQAIDHDSILWCRQLQIAIIHAFFSVHQLQSHDAFQKIDTMRYVWLGQEVQESLGLLNLSPSYQHPEEDYLESWNEEAEMNEYCFEDDVTLYWNLSSGFKVTLDWMKNTTFVMVSSYPCSSLDMLIRGNNTWLDAASACLELPEPMDEFDPRDPFKEHDISKDLQLPEGSVMSMLILHQESFTEDLHVFLGVRESFSSNIPIVKGYQFILTQFESHLSARKIIQRLSLPSQPRAVRIRLNRIHRSCSSVFGFELIPTIMVAGRHGTIWGRGETSKSVHMRYPWPEAGEAILIFDPRCRHSFRAENDLLLTTTLSGKEEIPKMLYPAVISIFFLVFNLHSSLLSRVHKRVNYPFWLISTMFYSPWTLVTIGLIYPVILGFSNSLIQSTSEFSTDMLILVCVFALAAMINIVVDLFCTGVMIICSIFIRFTFLNKVILSMYGPQFDTIYLFLGSFGISLVFIFPLGILGIFLGALFVSIVHSYVDKKSVTTYCLYKQKIFQLYSFLWVFRIGPFLLYLERLKKVFGNYNMLSSFWAIISHDVFYCFFAVVHILLVLKDSLKFRQLISMPSTDSKSKIDPLSSKWSHRILLWASMITPLWTQIHIFRLLDVLSIVSIGLIFTIPVHRRQKSSSKNSWK